jgi:hypothetical protein
VPTARGPVAHPRAIEDCVRPVWQPAVNHFWRWADEPWVDLPGEEARVGQDVVLARGGTVLVEMGESRTPRPEPFARTHYERVR